IAIANQIGGATTIDFNVPGGGTIHLGSDLPTLTDPAGISINGANAAAGGGAIVIDGGATSNATGYRAFFVGVGAGEANANLPATTATAWSLSNLTIQNANARGGNGGPGGGGGAGLGGGLFVNAGA